MEEKSNILGSSLFFSSICSSPHRTSTVSMIFISYSHDTIITVIFYVALLSCFRSITIYLIVVYKKYESV